MKFEMPNDRKIIVKNELKGVSIYDNNKLWLLWIKCHVHIKDGEFISIIKSYNLRGGKTLSVELFKTHLDMFFKITFRSFVLNTLIKFEGSNQKWSSRDEAFLCFIGYMGCYEEALYVLYAVNEFRQYLYDHDW